VLAVVAATLLLLPGPTPGPASVSLVRLESAEAVDFGEGVVWVLAVGSDADADEDVMSGRADAIQLVGLDVETGRAAALGVPRDFVVDVPGLGRDRINRGLQEGGPEAMAVMVEELIGIAPQYVVTSKAAQFADMVDAIGGLTVRSPVAFVDPETGLRVRRGRNEFTGDEAATFAGVREPLTGQDFARSANQQALLRAILAKVREREDEEGFLEVGAVAAFGGLNTDVPAGLDTNLTPAEIYRFAHAITQVEPTQVVTCVLDGRPFTTPEGADVLRPNALQAQRLGDALQDDAYVRPQALRAAGC
jgi:LCP family protein required for cell wall assembly